MERSKCHLNNRKLNPYAEPCHKCVKPEISIHGLQHPSLPNKIMVSIIPLPVPISHIAKPLPLHISLIMPIHNPTVKMRYVSPSGYVDHYTNCTSPLQIPNDSDRPAHLGIGIPFNPFHMHSIATIAFDKNWAYNLLHIAKASAQHSGVSPQRYTADSLPASDPIYSTMIPEDGFHSSPTIQCFAPHMFTHSRMSNYAIARTNCIIYTDKLPKNDAEVRLLVADKCSCVSASPLNTFFQSVATSVMTDPIVMTFAQSQSPPALTYSILPLFDTPFRAQSDIYHIVGQSLRREHHFADNDGDDNSSHLNNERQRVCVEAVQTPTSPSGGGRASNRVGHDEAQTHSSAPQEHYSFRLLNPTATDVHLLQSGWTLGLRRNTSTGAHGLSLENPFAPKPSGNGTTPGESHPSWSPFHGSVLFEPPNRRQLQYRDSGKPQHLPIPTPSRPSISITLGPRNPFVAAQHPVVPTNSTLAPTNGTTTGTTTTADNNAVPDHDNDDSARNNVSAASTNLDDGTDPTTSEGSSVPTTPDDKPSGKRPKSPTSHKTSNKRKNCKGRSAD